MTRIARITQSVFTTRRITAPLLLLLLPAVASAQQPAADLAPRPDSVTVAAGAHYHAGGLYRFFFGGTYRDLWVKPVHVPLLNLSTYGGGLTPDKVGGGHETVSLKLTGSDEESYSFRSVDKRLGPLPKPVADVGMVKTIAMDQTSSSHPAANQVVASLLQAAGVLYESPRLTVMPDDSLLGKYRKEFGNRLGLLQLYPQKTKAERPGFANAIAVIDSDTLLQLLDRDPAERVDAPAFLAARLVDMLVGNWDRHQGQWKWAQLERGRGAAWEPISRDYDKGFISTNGLIPSIIRSGFTNLITFDNRYPSLQALTWNSLGLDRRLLDGLSKPVWDSVAQAVTRRLTDSVIDVSVHMMPTEYLTSAPALTAKLRIRRDSLPELADRFYRYLAGVVDVHATDAADHATITRVDDRYVEVRLEASDGATYFLRRFDASETSAIRVYLHGGDDKAVIVGDVPHSIELWVIGGNGHNDIVDSSRVGGRSHPTHVYDVGSVSDVSYGPDTLFDRRPTAKEFGQHVMPAKDHGAGMSPIFILNTNHDQGIVPGFGLAWHQYSFRHAPYASMISLQGLYSTKLSGLEVVLTADQRLESSSLHFTELARMSQLQMLNFHGLGNSSAQSPGLVSNVSAPRTDYFALTQRQWLFRPAVALGLGPKADLSFGPVLQYSVTDSTPGRFISVTSPYGAGHFGEAGLRLSLNQDSRSRTHHPDHGTLVDVSASYYPSVWDVHSGFGVLNAMGALYVTLPVPFHPYLGLRGGAKQVFGDFPFQEAAFIGGRTDVRVLDPQRYAGDASLYATAELRLRVATFSVLVPVNVGLLASQDIGRVYVKGSSPGGWHNAFGAGFWVAFHDNALDFRVVRANEVGRPPMLELRFVAPSMIW